MRFSLLNAMGAEGHTFNPSGQVYPAVRQTNPEAAGLDDLVLCGDFQLKLPPLDQFCTHLNSCRQ